MQNFTKSFFCILFLVFLVSAAYSQSGINYQAILRDPISGKEITKPVDVTFSIGIGSSAPGILAYEEMITLTPNQFGLVNHVIGTGTKTISSPFFSAIDWTQTKTKYWLTITVGKTGLPSTELNLVPFSYASNKVKSIVDHDLNALGDVVALNPAAEQLLKYNGTNWVPGNVTSGSIDTASVGVWNKLGGSINYSKGNVGVGSFTGYTGNAPNAKFHIYNTSTSAGLVETLRLTAGATAGGDGPNLVFQSAYGNNTPSNWPNWHLASIAGVYSGTGIFRGDLVFNTNIGIDGAATEKMRINSQGNVGIGINNPLDKLHVIGNIRASGNLCSANYTCPSDRRYKENIADLNGSLQNVLKLRGVSYDFRTKEFPEMKFSEKNQIGFIAQELEKLYPEFVITGSNGYKTVDYSKLTPVLVEAIKEQQQIIEQQKAEIEKVKSEQASSNKELQNIKASIEEIQNRLNVTSGVK